MSTTLRKMVTVMVGGACAVALALPVGATPGDDHKVTICHVTNSATNPYVVIEVDVAAFDGEGANDHTQHETKDGLLADAKYEDGYCQWDGGVVVVDDPPADL